MSLRLFVDLALEAGAEFDLPEAAARHAQVRRVQPGHTLTLFNGDGHDWPATVLAMGRTAVQVRLGAAAPVARELPLRVVLALGMPANERMDGLVEKATELGAAEVQPLHTARSVLRLQGERAARKQAHWQGVAVAASEQCGRAQVPLVSPVQELADGLPGAAATPASLRLLLSLQPDARPLAALLAPANAAVSRVSTLSGPEGGLSPEEEAAARAAGFQPVALGPRVLRADTAPLAVLAWLGLNLAAPAGPGA